MNIDTTMDHTADAMVIFNAFRDATVSILGEKFPLNLFLLEVLKLKHWGAHALVCFAIMFLS